MGDRVKVAGQDEFKEPVQVVHHQNQRIAVFRINGEFYAIADECSHASASLAEGDLEGYTIECLRHGARFDVRTGKHLCFPAVAPVRSYPVIIVDGVVYIEV